LDRLDNGSLYLELHGQLDGRTRTYFFLQIAILAILALYAADAGGGGGGFDPAKAEPRSGEEEWQQRLGARTARHKFDCCGSRLGGQDAVEDASGVSAVLGPVGSVDFVIDVAAGVGECDVLLNTTGSQPTLVPLLGTSEPLTTAPPNRSNV